LLAAEGFSVAVRVFWRSGHEGLHRKAQVCRHWQLEQVTAQKPGGKKHDFQVLDLAGRWVQPGDHIVAQFLRFLVGVRRTFIDMQDVGLTVVLEGQFRFHSATPSASFLAKYAVTTQCRPEGSLNTTTTRCFPPLMLSNQREKRRAFASRALLRTWSGSASVCLNWPRYAGSRSGWRSLMCCSRSSVNSTSPPR